jgi:hypothetical protein
MLARLLGSMRCVRRLGGGIGGVLLVPAAVAAGVVFSPGSVALANSSGGAVSSAAPAKSSGDSDREPSDAKSQKAAPEKSATAKPVADKPPATKPAPTGVSELSAEDHTFLTELLTQAGAPGAAIRSMERTPERQVAVMLRLAADDLSKAKAMYCAAGDRVLERFDASTTPEKNHAAMLEMLLSVLPEARGIGCLNHIRNKDVLSVDVKVDDIPEAKRDAFVKAAEAAVSAGKVARFLAPPREPDAFHFEFKRRSE